MTTRKVPIQEVLSYLSAEAACRSGYYPIVNETVGDFLFGTLRTHGDVPFAVTLQSMRTYGQEFPVYADLAEKVAPHYGIDPLGAEGRMALGNGHNRVEAAFYLGWTEIEVTDDFDECGLAAGLAMADELKKVKV